MTEIITEKNYPIQKLWAFKPAINSLLTPLLASSVGLVLLRLNKNNKAFFHLAISIIVGWGILSLIITFIATLLEIANFHYSIREKFLIIKQGILSKQQRHIPYGAIQNLFVKQDLFDRFFGLASLTIENASQGAENLAILQQQKIFGLRVGNQPRQRVEKLGSSGNKVIIPGLTKANAEILKGIILEKMKENPIEDSQSGL